MAKGMRANMSLAGADELQGGLKLIGTKGAKRVVRAEMTKTSRRLTRSVKQQAPVGPSKNLKRSIMFRIATYANGNIVGIIGSRKGQAPHAHIVEEGTKERFTEEGASRGEMPALHFVKKTYNALASLLQQWLLDGIKHGIVKEEAKRVAKMSKKGNRLRKRGKL